MVDEIRLLPYFDRNNGRDHVFIFTHDNGMPCHPFLVNLTKQRLGLAQSMQLIPMLCHTVVPATLTQCIAQLSCSSCAALGSAAVHVPPWAQQLTGWLCRLLRIHA